MTATVGEAGFDPATIDLCDIARYQREGYPWAEFTWLRENAPVFRHETESAPPFWAVTRHADVHEVHSHPEVFINGGPILRIGPPCSSVGRTACAPSADWRLASRRPRYATR